MRDNGPHRQFRAFLLDGSEISVVKGFGTYSTCFDGDESTSEVAFFKVNGEDFVAHPKFDETAREYFDGDSIYGFVPDVTIINFIKSIGIAEIAEQQAFLSIEA